MPLDTPTIGQSIASLLNRQVDDQTHINRVRAHAAVAQEETHLQAQLLPPLVPDVSRLLDVHA